MKVGIDTFGSDHGRSGVGSYLASFVKGLPTESENQYELFGSELDRYTFDSGEGKISYAGIDIDDKPLSNKFWHFFSLNRFAKKQGYDIILCPAGSRMLPLFSSIPTVVVINEVVSEMLKSVSFLYRLYMIKSLRHATKIIATSKYIFEDLLKLKIKPKQIEIIHNGIDHSLFYPRNEFSSDVVIIRPFAIKKPYFIYASRIEYPEKQHIELIKAFNLFKKKTLLPHRLVLAGVDGVNAEKVHKEAANSEFASDIFLIGYFPHESLPELYSCADACLFPAITEGVGLPIIEAMACGIPVACATEGVLPEIAGDCALYFDTKNIQEMADTIEQIVVDKEKRSYLIRCGFDWVRRFSWDTTVEKTIAVLTSLVK